MEENQKERDKSLKAGTYTKNCSFTLWHGDLLGVTVMLNPISVLLASVLKDASKLNVGARYGLLLMPQNLYEHDQKVKRQRDKCDKMSSNQ